MKETNSTFPSSDREHTIAYTLWEPEDTPRAVLQVSHGMCEHRARYAELAEFLCAQGVAVCACDHLGHGGSASPEELGYFGGRGSISHLTDDLDLLRRTVRKKYRSLPYVLLGHSMGSFVARDYITRYQANIDGAIICGTAGANKHIKAAINLSAALCRLRGRKYRSQLLRSMVFKNYNSRFPEDDENAWLTRDSAIRESYGSDPLSGFCFTAGGYNEMFHLLSDVSGMKWAAKVPLSLPVLIISGADDPVGDYGAGPREVYSLLHECELCDLEIKIYEGMRHEILNEQGRGEVMQDILDWTLRVAGGVVECRTM